jgi:hypothetical protein
MLPGTLESFVFQDAAGEACTLACDMRVSKNPASPARVRFYEAVIRSRHARLHLRSRSSVPENPFEGAATTTIDAGVHHRCTL